MSMSGSCVLAHSLDTLFLLERRAGQNPEIWPEKLLNGIPTRTGPEIAKELAGRKLIKFALDQFEGARPGKGSWVTVTPSCPKCAGVMFHLPRERIERHWAILVDAEKVGEIQGPRRCMIGYGFEYYLPKGYTEDALVHEFGSYVGDPNLPVSEESFEPMNEEAIRVASLQFSASLAGLNVTVLYEATERHTIIEWAAAIDLGVAWDTYVSLGMWEIEPNSNRLGLRGSVAQMHGQDKYFLDFTERVSIEHEDYSVVQRGARDVLSQALDAGQRNLSNDPDAQHIPSLSAFTFPWPER